MTAAAMAVIDARVHAAAEVAPTSTSLTSWRVTAWRNRRSSSSWYSCRSAGRPAVPRIGSPSTRCAAVPGGSQQVRASRNGPPAAACTPSSRVRSVKMFWKVKYSSSASRSSHLAEARDGQDGLLLRGKCEPAGLLRVVQRLDAVAVARQEQLPLPAIPEREGEHAVEALERTGCPTGRERVEHHLGVRLRPETVARRFQLGPQLAEVVDLAVVAEHIALVADDHRLMPGRREIDDRQPAVTQADAALDPVPLAVGPAMRDGIGHSLEHDRRRRPCHRDGRCRQCRTWPASPARAERRRRIRSRRASSCCAAEWPSCGRYSHARPGNHPGAGRSGRGSSPACAPHACPAGSRFPAPAGPP